MASIYRWRDGWRAQVRSAGQSVSRTFPTRGDATRWARAIEHRADNGERVAAARRSVASLLTQYEESRMQVGRPVRGKSNENYMLRRLRGWFTDPLDRLDTPAILAYAQARKRQGAGPYTINMELSKLGTALRYACSIRGITHHDPVGAARPALHHLGLVGSGRKRERRPTADEWSALLVALAKQPTAIPMVDVVQLAALIGLRRSEICRIVWSDLDQERRVIVVRDRKDPRPKAGNDEAVPLIGGALDIIMRQPRKDTRIFPFEPGTISLWFKRACDAAGIVDLHFHDMRHEAASALFEAGWQIPEVAAVTGHKTWANLKRYVQLDPAEVAKKGR